MAVQFSGIDQVVHLLDAPTAPWSIQLELGVAGRLHEARLRGAIAASLRQHPMARARKQPTRVSAHFDSWIVDPYPRLDPLRVVECPDEESVSVVRADLQGIAPPLVESPPLRIVLARRPGGDLLMINANHAAMDGFGVLQVMRSIALAYAGTPEPVAGIEFDRSRDFGVLVADRTVRARLRRQLALTGRLGDLVTPTARVAMDGADQGVHTGGYGFVHHRLTAEETSELVRAAKPATVNDILVAALHLTIAEWNAAHDQPCGRISVLVPANLRPAAWRTEVVGNYSLPARVVTSPRDRRDPATALRAVAAGTERKKQVGMGTAFGELLSQTQILPLWAKRAGVLALPVTGNRLVDTAMLSNLGRVEDLPLFGGEGGGVEEMWFSPPARMPLGVTVGAVTAAGRLHLVVRYRRRQFDRAAGERFTAELVRQLDRYCH